MKKLIKKIKKFLKKINCTKLVLGFVLVNGMAMMWCSYILAWFDRITIAETLSSTVADVIVGTIIAYLCTKTVENVSKYGSRLNGTAKEQIEEIEVPIEEEQLIEIKEERNGRNN